MLQTCQIFQRSFRAAPAQAAKAIHVKRRKLDSGLATAPVIEPATAAFKPDPVAASRYHSPQVRDVLCRSLRASLGLRAHAIRASAPGMWNVTNHLLCDRMIVDRMTIPPKPHEPARHSPRLADRIRLAAVKPHGRRQNMQDQPPHPRQPRQPLQPRHPRQPQPRQPHHESSSDLAACGSSRLNTRNEPSVTSDTSTSRRSMVRTLLVCGAIAASAGLLSAQAAPASDNDTPTRPSALPLRLIDELSLERAIKVLLQEALVATSTALRYQPSGARSISSLLVERSIQ
jgi:hypothetical protein